MRVVFAYDGYEHLGIGSLTATLRTEGHDVCLVQAPVGDYIRGYRDPGVFALERNAQEIASLQPDVAAFSLVSPTAGVMMRLAKRVRSAGIKTLCGGPHATAEPEITLRSGGFDGLIRGEGERVISDALRILVNGSGRPDWLATPDHPHSLLPPIPDLDLLPFPAKDLFYAQHPELTRDYLLATSRGCPFTCAFCAGAWKSGKPRHRRRSPANVLTELLGAVQRFAPGSIYFVDDLFTLSRAWLKQFLPSYKATVGLPFHCITHPACLDDEVAHLLSEAGCGALRIGVQTLTPGARAALGRTETTEQVARAIDAATHNGIRVEVDHMIDLPDETPDEVAEASAFYLVHRPAAIKVYWLTPLPGSAWMESASASGVLNAERAEAYRRGEGYGPHSYLFCSAREGRRWLGIHVLLAFLPFMPEWWTRFLVRTRLYRVLRIPSFALAVGGSRLFAILQGWDEVGKSHLRRLMHRPVRTA